MHILPWSCLNCNFFFQMRIGPKKGDQKLGSCTELDHSIDFSISSTHLWQLKKIPPTPHLKVWIHNVVKGDVCLLFCFALNEVIMEALPKCSHVSYGAFVRGLGFGFGCLVAKLSPPKPTSMYLMQKDALGLLG